MGRTAYHDESHARVRLDERVGKRADNKLANAMRALPRYVKERWPLKFRKDAETAFSTLLKGASHVCPNCKHDNGPEYACACDRPNVQALRLYAELAGAVGPANQLIVNLNAQLGVRDETELASLVGAGRRLKQLGESPPETMLADALEVVYLAVRQQPDLAGLAMAGLERVASVSGAVLLESHQQAQGNATGDNGDGPVG